MKKAPLFEFGLAGKFVLGLAIDRRQLQIGLVAFLLVINYPRLRFPVKWFWIFLLSIGTANAQALPDAKPATDTITEWNEGAQQDTIALELLVTGRRGLAYKVLGYQIVLHNRECDTCFTWSVSGEYLDDRYRRFRDDITVWAVSERKGVQP
jgi:hypothetical protein